MKLFKAQRVALVAILSTLTMGAMSFLPGALGSQIAGAASPALSLSANPSSTVASGTPVTFTSTLSGATSPVGDIAAGFYTDPSCNDFAFSIDISPGGVSGNGSYTSAAVTPAVGNYYGSAFFTDSNTAANDASSGFCDLTLVVSPLAATSLTLSASPSSTVTSGTPVTFTATLSGGSSPTGDISLGAYLNDPSCSLLTPTFSEDVSVTGSNGPYNFAPVTPAPGSYYGEAYYGGDTNNAPSSSGSCDLILVVSPAPHHVHSCRTVLNLGPTFLDLIYMEGPDSAFTLYLDSLAPCVVP
jgi:hypothetical protein